MNTESNTTTSGITSNLENENENRNDNTSGNGCNENGDENVNSDEMDDSTDEDYESPEEIRMKEAEEKQKIIEAKKKEKQRKLDDQKYEIRRRYHTRSYIICQQGESLPSSLKYGSTIEDNKEYKMPIYYSLIYSIYVLYTLCYPRQRKWYRFFSYEKEALPVEITTLETHSEVVARQNNDLCGKKKCTQLLQKSFGDDIIGKQSLRYIIQLSRILSYSLYNDLDKVLTKSFGESYIRYHIDDDDGVVRRYTCIVKPAIKEFLNNISKNLYLDGTFCCNSGRLLCFCFLDANHHLQPIACHYCQQETSYDLDLLLKEMWVAGMNEAKHLIFVSDDGTAINSFVGKLSKELEGVNVEHVKCVVHLLRHIKDRMKKEDTLENYSDVRKIFYFARHSPTENVANTFLYKIKEKSEAAHKYIKDGHMSSFIYTYDTEHFLADTNNVSESLNSQMKLLEVNGKSVREASVFGCIYRFFIVAFNQMHYRKQDTFCLDPELKDYTKNYNYYCKFILKELSFLGYYYEVNQDHYTVNKTMNKAGMYVVKDHELYCDFKVNFNERKCSCRMFQQN